MKNNQLNLKIGDRIQLQNILPGEDAFERLLMREIILKKVKINEKEISTHNLRTEGGSIMWEKSDISYSYEFDENEREYVKGCLKELSDKKKLTADALGLYKTFVNGSND